MKAEIITIGDEILLGQIVDTNSAWIAETLAPLHIEVLQITSISDTAEAITTALTQASARAELVLVTGGLGPTQDDVTKQTAATFFGTTLVRDPDVLAHVEKLFSRHLGRGDMPARNYAQADVLANAEVLFNEMGTAPGMWVERDGVRYAFLPGVPFEMKYLVEKCILPKLTEVRKGTELYHAHLLTVGLGESYLADQIADIEAELPAHLHLAYLPKIGQVRLRLSAQGEDYHAIKRETDYFADQIAARLERFLVCREDIPFAQAIISAFGEKSLKVATAESCTGGAIAAQITVLPGASQVFDCGVVAYENKIKEKLLGVQAETLAEFGAVSEETVRQMAEGVRKLSGANYGVATSGIAGPTGGTDEKPVGTVWIAVASEKETVARRFQFPNTREVNIERSVMQALILLWNVYRQEQEGFTK